MKGGSQNKGRLLALSAVAFAALAAAVPDVAYARSDRSTEASRPTLLPRHSSGRVVIVVSTDLQKLTVYDDGIPVATTTVSTGVAEHPTPHGIFSIIGKERFHRSNIYSDAPMPWMQRITWSGVALHEGHVTGRPASHGCIRMPAAFAVELFRYTREGARVIIAREDVVPSPWGSVAAFNSGTFAKIATTQVTASTPAQAPSSAPYDIEIEARPRISAAPVLPQRRDIAAHAPLSLLVSRKTGKLYVRRAFTPVFQVPITIDDPARPLGTHLFMAQDDASRWLAMTVSAKVREASLIDEGRKGRPRDGQPMALPPSDAAEALSRIHLPPGTAEYVASLLTPGATLILSDDSARNRETWDGTNFIALSE